MKNRSAIVLLGVASILLLVSFLFARCGEERRSQPAADAGSAHVVEFPRDKAKRLQRVQAAVRGTQPAQPPRPASDLVERALRGKDSDGALFVEINAIRHSPLAEKILRCREQELMESFEDLKKEVGIDPSQDVDRIGFDGDTLVVSGFFSDLTMPPKLGEPMPHGDAGRLWQIKGDDGASFFVGQVGDGLLVTHFEEAGVKAAIDRAEGRAESAPPLPAGVSAAEVYGVVGPQMLKSLLADSQEPMAAQMGEMLQQGIVRMNVEEEVAMSFDLKARTEQEGEDLAKALGAALAVGRKKAQAEGATEFARLLEQARIVPGAGGAFELDLAVPGESILRMMGCDLDARPAP